MASRTLAMRAMSLPRRQRDVLVAAANGSTLDATAAALDMSTSTVRDARRRALLALGAHTITHAVTLAISAGVIDIDHHGRAQ